MAKKFIITAMLALCCGVNQGKANVVYCVNCSESWTQALDRVTNVEQLNQLYLEYAESIQQTAHQLQNVQQNIEMLTDMAHNTANLPSKTIQKIYNEMTRLAQITNAINTIRADIEGTAKIYDEFYRSQYELNKLANLPNRMLTERNIAIRADMDKMNSRVDDATKATFQLSSNQLRELEDAGKTEDYINELVSTAEGRNEMLQAGNQLAKMQLTETRQMRELIATTVQSNLATQVRDEKERQKALEIGEYLLDTKDWKIKSKEDPF